MSTATVMPRVAHTQRQIGMPRVALDVRQVAEQVIGGVLVPIAFVLLSLLIMVNTAGYVSPLLTMVVLTLVITGSRGYRHPVRARGQLR